MVCFDPGSSSYLPFEQRSCEDVVAKFAWVGDGMCDFEGLYNTAKCSWDGGDCCSSTCVSSEMGFECFSSQFHCLDVDASDYGSGSGLCIVDYEEWLGDGGWVGLFVGCMRKQGIGTGTTALSHTQQTQTRYVAVMNASAKRGSA